MTTPTKKYIAISALGAAIVGGFLSASASYAYRGNPAQSGNGYSPERHEQMEKAFENNDYEAWKNLMQDRGRARIMNVINEDNFSKFAEMRKLMHEGKLDEANKIREELGLGERGGRRDYDKDRKEKNFGRRANLVGEGNGWDCPRGR